MKGEVKKKSERNLTKSSTSLCRGVQIASGRISNHLEEQTKASSKLAAQSTVGLLASEQQRKHQTASHAIAFSDM